MDNVVSFHLTFEEQNVLRECARESFIYRCLPLTVVGCFSAKYCQKSGLIKGHPIYGMTVKYLTIFGVAYLLGKFSYISECKEKILKRIPNSNLADAVRKSNPSTIFQGNVGKRHDTTNSNGFRNEAEGDLVQNKFSDVFDQTEIIGKEFKPDNDNGSEKAESKPKVTYDSLRMKNRQEFFNQQKSMIQKSQSNETNDAHPAVQNELMNVQQSGKYGDEGCASENVCSRISSVQKFGNFMDRNSTFKRYPE
ncbi:OCIA domain-containing protein 1 [Trichinella murrelli]|uniref:OCIA domain-containing protein 1 n=1 Tax=Trichinella murrelli TaxID=144512 RepID=A0A0V0TYA0_9BILA|nr:OCIA domain-containing protein 1 [Trichinella murrelli]